MKIIREDDREESFSIRGLTAAEVGVLHALADFPLWMRQSSEVAEFCESLIGAAGQVVGETGAVVPRMVPAVTADMR